MLSRPSSETDILMLSSQLDRKLAQCVWFPYYQWGTQKTFMTPVHSNPGICLSRYIEKGSCSVLGQVYSQVPKYNYRDIFLIVIIIIMKNKNTSLCLKFDSHPKHFVFYSLILSTKGITILSIPFTDEKVKQDFRWYSQGHKDNGKWTSEFTHLPWLCTIASLHKRHFQPHHQWGNSKEFPPWLHHLYY